MGFVLSAGCSTKDRLEHVRHSAHPPGCPARRSSGSAPADRAAPWSRRLMHPMRRHQLFLRPRVTDRLAEMMLDHGASLGPHKFAVAMQRAALRGRVPIGADERDAGRPAGNRLASPDYKLTPPASPKLRAGQGGQAAAGRTIR